MGMGIVCFSHPKSMPEMGIFKIKWAYLLLRLISTKILFAEIVYYNTCVMECLKKRVIYVTRNVFPRLISDLKYSSS